MIQPFTGSVPSEPSLFFPLDRTATRIFRYTLPKELHDLTASEIDDEDPLTLEDQGEEASLLEFIAPTGWSESIPVEQSTSVNIQELYERSGLTWKQIAALIGVSLRMVHFWISGEKKISEEHDDIVNHVIRLISILNLGPAYRVRKFFEDSILVNESVLALIKNKEFSALEHWVQERAYARRPEPLETSAAFFENRLPERPITLVSAQQDTHRHTKKAKLARVHRKRNPS